VITIPLPATDGPLFESCDTGEDGSGVNVAGRRAPNTRPRSRSATSVVAGNRQQVENDAAQPRNHNPGANRRYERHKQGGDDFDDTDPKHEGVGGHRKHSGHEWREVLVPVDEKVKELVDARTERSNHERNVRDVRRAGRLPKILKTKRRS
jgi:hypothetical protein